MAGPVIDQKATNMMMMNRAALYEYSDDENDDIANATPSNMSQAEGSAVSYSCPRTAGGLAQGTTNHRNGRPSHFEENEYAKGKATFKGTRDSSLRSSVSTGSSRRSMSSQSTTSSSSRTQLPPQDITDHRTIVLFGGTGKVGQAFLRRALDAGYQVRHFVTDATSPHRTSAGGDDTTADTRASKSTKAANLLQTIVGSSLYDTDAIETALHDADFVVCLLNDAVTVKTYPSNTFLAAFVKHLYPLLKQVPSIQLFLLQVSVGPSSDKDGHDTAVSHFLFFNACCTKSTSLSSDIQGATPVLSKLVKVLAHATGRTLQLTDHDGVMEYLAMEHGRYAANKRNPEVRKSQPTDSSPRHPHFHYLVTRPTVLVKDGPASKRLCASKSVSSPCSCP
jgi:NmrA-like family